MLCFRSGKSAPEWHCFFKRPPRLPEVASIVLSAVFQVLAEAFAWPARSVERPGGARDVRQDRRADRPIVHDAKSVLQRLDYIDIGSCRCGLEDRQQKGCSISQFLGRDAQPVQIRRCSCAAACIVSRSNRSGSTRPVHGTAECDSENGVSDGMRAHTRGDRWISDLIRTELKASCFTSSAQTR